MFADYGSIHLTDTIKYDWSHPLHIVTDITKPIGKVLTAAYKPLEHTLRQVEQHVIRPYLAPLIKPIAQVMPKITIAGHKYDLGGSQTLQKAATGAVAGTATGGFPYGTIAGALVAGLTKGRPDVANNLVTGAVAGYFGPKLMEAGSQALSTSALQDVVGTSTSTMASTIPGTGGMTGQQMLDAGATPQQVSEIISAANAPGGIAANAAMMPSVGDQLSAALTTSAATGTGLTMAEVAQGVGVAAAGVGLAEKTGLLKSGQSTAATEPNQANQQSIEAGIADFIKNNKVLVIAIGASLVIGVILLASSKSKPKVITT